MKKSNLYLNIIPDEGLCCFWRCRVTNSKEAVVGFSREVRSKEVERYYDRLILNWSPMILGMISSNLNQDFDLGKSYLNEKSNGLPSPLSAGLSAALDLQHS